MHPQNTEGPTAELSERIADGETKGKGKGSKGAKGGKKGRH